MARHRTTAFVQLITAAALALSTAVAATAVSIGMARADLRVSQGDCSLGNCLAPLPVVAAHRALMLVPRASNTRINQG
jgi:hypothetical protein